MEVRPIVVVKPTPTLMLR